MIESSLIAGTQPAGAGSLLVGIAGALPVAASSAAVASAGLPAGAAGDGFRERFEASVGLEGPVADVSGKTGGVRSGSVGTGFFGRGLALTDASKRPVDGTGEDGAVADPVLAAGDSEDGLDAAPAGGPHVTGVTVAAGDGIRATETSGNAADGTRWMGQHTKPVGAGQPKGQIEGWGTARAEGTAVASKAHLVSRPVLRQSDPAALSADDSAAQDVSVSAPKNPEGASDKPAIAETDAAKACDRLKTTLSESGGSPVLLPPKGVAAVAAKAGIQFRRGATLPGRDGTQSIELASTPQPAPAASGGIAKNSLPTVKTTGVLTRAAQKLPARVGTVPVTSEQAVDGKNVVAVAVAGAILTAGAAVPAVAPGNQDAGIPGVESKRDGIAVRGSKKKPDVGTEADVSHPATSATGAVAPSMVPSVPNVVTVPNAALVAASVPVAGSVASAGAPVVQGVAAAPTRMPSVSAEANPGDVRGLNGAPAANAPAKDGAFGTPVAGVGMSFGEVAEAVSTTADLVPASAPTTHVAVGQDATMLKPQDAVGRTQDLQHAAALKDDVTQSAGAATEAIDAAPVVRTAHLMADIAGTIEALQPLPDAVSAVPAAVAPARAGGPGKNAPAGRVSSVSGANAIDPVVSVAASASAGTPVGNEKPAGAAGVGKGLGDSTLEAKAAFAHVVPEAAQSLSAALVSPQVHAGGVADSKVAPADAQGPTVLRGAELTGAVRGENALEHATLVSTPNVLEVGVASGTNGWLKVRAEMDGSGGVAASVVATTASAAEALHKELPALSAYLRDESVGVSSLVVNRADGGAMAQDATSNFGSGSFGAGAQAGRGGQSGASDVPVQPEPMRDAVDATMRNVRFDGAGTSAATAGYGRASGGWLNVVA